MIETYLAQHYRQLIKEVLVSHKVKAMRFIGGDFAKKYSDALVYENGDMLIYYHGTRISPVRNFFFDFTLDFAVLLAEIETDLFRAKRGKTKHIEFDFYE